MISREEAVKLLNSLHYKILHTSFCNRVREAEIEALVMAKKLLEQPKTDWIPCEVKMPKENFCSVWVSFTSPYTSYVRKVYWENGQFVWDNRKPIKDKPVAWMKYYPPQPYKKEGAE